MRNFPPTLIAILGLIPLCAATEWDDFTNNLATDLAPLIQLFGEQVTKQFLSESIDIWDNIIFAMAPLGILTAVVSAIRIRGNASLKAFIGRAQESVGTAELELLSSTSPSVGEVWNESGIARVIGRPKILEIVRLKNPADDDYRESVTKGYTSYTIKTKTLQEQDDQLGLWDMPPRKTQPNIALNLGVALLSRTWFIGAAVFGAVLQIGVLVYAAFITYQYPTRFIQDDVVTPSYGMPLTVVGTTLLCLGMFLCSRILEQSTSERYYKPKHDTKVFWIQLGGQKIGDQVFGSFIGQSNRKTYIRSMKNDATPSQALLWLAILVSVIGFVLQFIGLRAVHPSVTVAQLGSTLIMALIRAMLRAQRLKGKYELASSNTKPSTLLEGRELEWFTDHVESPGAIVFSRIQDPSLRKIGSSSARTLDSSAKEKAIRTRVRLAVLTSSGIDVPWSELPVRKISIRLQSAIGQVMNCFAELIKANKDQDTFYEIPISFQGKYLNQIDENGPALTLDLPFFLHLQQRIGPTWTMYVEELEAIIGLWEFSIQRNLAEYGNATGADAIYGRLIDIVVHGGTRDVDSTDREIETWYKIWIQRQGHLSRMNLGSNGLDWKPKQNLFGWHSTRHPKPLSNTSTGTAYWIKSYCSMLQMCAQDIFVTILTSLIKEAPLPLGETTNRRDAIMLANTKDILLENTLVENVADIFEHSQLGSREEAYACIIPVMIHKWEVLGIGKATEAVLQAIDEYKNQSEWDNAQRWLKWLCKHTRNPESDNNYTRLGNFYLQACLKDRDVRKLGFEGICDLLDEQNGREGNDATTTQDYGWIALRIAEDYHSAEFLKNLRMSGAKDNRVPGYDTHRDDLIYWAKEGNSTVLRYLLCRVTTTINRTDNEGRTALSWAAECGHYGVVDFLINRGANCRKSDDDNKTPLAYAAEYGMNGIVHLLLRADPGVLSQTTLRKRQTVLMLAAGRIESELIRDIEILGAEIAREAQVTKYTEVITNLLEHPSVGIGKQDAEGNTAIAIAAQKGHEESVKLLLRKGASVVVRNHAGRSALDLAEDNGHDNIVKLLRSDRVAT